MSDGTGPLQSGEVETKSMADMREAFEKQGKELAEERERLAGFEKAEAFRSAGVPDGDEGTVYDLFRKSYQGELNPESINEAYGKLGIPEPQANPQPEQQAQPAGGQPAAEPQAQPQVDAATAAAIADGQQIRTQFSPGLEDAGASLLEAIGSANTADEIEQLARNAGVPMPS